MNEKKEGIKYCVYDRNNVKDVEYLDDPIDTWNDALKIILLIEDQNCCEMVITEINNYKKWYGGDEPKGDSGINPT